MDLTLGIIHHLVIYTHSYLDHLAHKLDKLGVCRTASAPKGLLNMLRNLKEKMSRQLALAFQPCVGKQRIAYHPSLHQGRVDPESARSPVISDQRPTSPIKFIFDWGQDKYVIFIWV